MKLIGLGGKPRAGKDTVAAYLWKAFNFRHRAFGDNMRDAVAAAYNVTSDQLDGPLKDAVDPRWDMTPRDMMAQMAAAMRHQYGDDFWVRSLEVEGLKGHTVISDVRWPVEAMWIRNQGGILVRVVREDHTEATHEQPSECALDDFDWDHEISARSGGLMYLRMDINSIVGRRWGL